MLAQILCLHLRGEGDRAKARWRERIFCATRDIADKKRPKIGWGVKHRYGALPRTPLKELFEKSSLRSLKNFSAFSF